MFPQFKEQDRFHFTNLHWGDLRPPETAPSPRILLMLDNSAVNDNPPVPLLEIIWHSYHHSYTGVGTMQWKLIMWRLGRHQRPGFALHLIPIVCISLVLIFDNDRACSHALVDWTIPYLKTRIIRIIINNNNIQNIRLGSAAEAQQEKS